MKSKTLIALFLLVGSLAPAIINKRMRVLCGTQTISFLLV